MRLRVHCSGNNHHQPGGCFTLSSLGEPLKTSYPPGSDCFVLVCLTASQSVALRVMVYAPASPWRVALFYFRNPPGPNTRRFKIGFWFLQRKMPWIAQKVWDRLEAVQVSGPEMEQL
jgi:hypothetical protein